MLYAKLGEQNKKMVFLLTDQHVVEEGFLELVNNMLTSGMVPALYADDEKDALVGSVRDEAVAGGLLPTRDALWTYFVNKCAANLHVVMAMSPVGELLRSHRPPPIAQRRIAMSVSVCLSVCLSVSVYVCPRLYL